LGKSKNTAFPLRGIWQTSEPFTADENVWMPWKALSIEWFHVKHQRIAVAPGSWQDNSAARTASIAFGRGKVTRQTKPTVRDGCLP